MVWDPRVGYGLPSGASLDCTTVGAKTLTKPAYREPTGGSALTRLSRAASSSSCWRATMETSSTSNSCSRSRRAHGPLLLYNADSKAVAKMGAANLNQQSCSYPRFCSFETQSPVGFVAKPTGYSTESQEKLQGIAPTPELSGRVSLGNKETYL